MFLLAGGIIADYAGVDPHGRDPGSARGAGPGRCGGDPPLQHRVKDNLNCVM